MPQGELEFARRWNPRYVAFAAAHGRTPEAQREADAVAWPGGINTGFMVWLHGAWRQWRRLRVIPRDEEFERHEDFDHWLQIEIALVTGAQGNS